MCYMQHGGESAGRDVGVRELRQNLSVHLARVRRGETLTVTERRQVVAVLAPATRSSDALARLVAEGRVVAARETPTALPKPLRLALGRPLSQIVRDLGDDTV
jgi:antitoxin (DNA-binding transcriptional repressor) of toxin-antitoxin stability system